LRSHALDNLTRREVLRAGLAVGGGLVLASTIEVPGVMERAVYAAAVENAGGGEPIGLVHLQGGHDGLSTVVPLTDGLEAVRPGDANDLIQGALDAGTRLTRDFALHPSLTAIARRFREGHVAVLMDVGYPMASRSHEQATWIWQTGDPSSRQVSGAFGRVAARVEPQGRPLALAGLGGQGAPAMLRGQRPVAVLPRDPAAFAFKGAAEQALGTLWKSGVAGPFGQALTDCMATARDTGAQVRAMAAGYRAQARYDDAAGTPPFQSRNDLSCDLQVAAALIKGGSAPAVFHATHGGWDTHANQQARQADLLRQLDQAIDAFLTDCAAAGGSPTIITWSEFGRTVRFNSSGGTDHGDASPVLVIGQNVSGGIYGSRPNLTGYDVPMQTDFRSVYATLIEHMGVDPKVVVGAFAPLPFLRGPGPPATAPPPPSPGAPAPAAPPATPQPPPPSPVTPASGARP
jgi:uncharacterized protein (DUF1501 family)